MLSSQRRQDGRETRAAAATSSDSLMAERFQIQIHSDQGPAQSVLAQQMAQTVRPTGFSGSAQSVATTTPHPQRVRAAYRALDHSNAPSLGQTDHRLDRGARHPTRTAPSLAQTDALAEHDQSELADAPCGLWTEPDRPGVLSQAVDHPQRHPARAGLDLPLSGRWSEGLCVSYAAPAHPRLYPNHRRRQKHRHAEAPLPGHVENAGNPRLFATRQRRCFLVAATKCRGFLVSSFGCVCFWASS